MRTRNAALRKYRKRLSHNRIIPASYLVVGADRHGNPIVEDSEGYRITPENQVYMLGENNKRVTLVQKMDPEVVIYTEQVGHAGPRWKKHTPPIQNQFHFHEQAVLSFMPHE